MAAKQALLKAQEAVATFARTIATARRIQLPGQEVPPAEAPGPVQLARDFYHQQMVFDDGDAIGMAELQQFLAAVQENGWIIKPTEKLPVGTPAEFFPRKRRFYYNPERFTVLDMMHEQTHLELFKQRGNWKTGKGQVWRDEIEAYTFEYEIMPDPFFKRLNPG